MSHDMIITSISTVIISSLHVHFSGSVMFLFVVPLPLDSCFVSLGHVTVTHGHCHLCVIVSIDEDHCFLTHFFFGDVEDG